MMMVKIVDIILPGPPLVYMTGRATVDLDQLSTVPMLVKLKDPDFRLLFNNFWWYTTPLIWTLTPNQLFQASIRFSNLIWLD